VQSPTTVAVIQIALCYGKGYLSKGGAVLEGQVSEGKGRGDESLDTEYPKGLKQHYGR